MNENKLQIIFDFFRDKCYSEKIFPGFRYKDKIYIIDAYWVSKIDNKFKICVSNNGCWEYLKDEELIDFIIKNIINDEY